MYHLQFYEIRLVECTERHFLTIRIISLMMMQQLLKMQIYSIGMLWLYKTSICWHYF